MAENENVDVDDDNECGGITESLNYTEPNVKSHLNTPDEAMQNKILHKEKQSNSFLYSLKSSDENENTDENILSFKNEESNLTTKGNIDNRLQAEVSETYNKETKSLNTNSDNIGDDGQNNSVTNETDTIDKSKIIICSQTKSLNVNSDCMSDDERNIEVNNGMDMIDRRDTDLDCNKSETTNTTIEQNVDDNIEVNSDSLKDDGKDNFVTHYINVTDKPDSSVCHQQSETMIITTENNFEDNNKVTNDNINKDEKDNLLTNNIDGTDKPDIGLKCEIINDGKEKEITDSINSNESNIAKTVGTDAMPLVRNKDKTCDFKHLKEFITDNSKDNTPGKQISSCSTEDKKNHDENKELSSDKTNESANDAVVKQFGTSRPFKTACRQNVKNTCPESKENSVYLKDEANNDSISAHGNQQSLNKAESKNIDGIKNANSDISHVIFDSSNVEDKYLDGLKNANPGKSHVLSEKSNIKVEHIIFPWSRNDECVNRQFFALNTVQTPDLYKKTDNAKKIRRKKYYSKQNKRNKTCISTFVDKCVVYTCFIHDRRVEYWCETCKALRCEKCVNIVYSKHCINHDVISMANYILKEQTQRRDKIQEISQACLEVLNRSMKVLQVNEEQVELKEIFRRDQIRQEFVAFNQLLIDEEQKILNKLDKEIQDYRSKNRSTKETYWQLVEKEARLMCECLHEMDKTDPYGENLKVLDKLISDDWGNLLANATIVGHSVEPIPSGIENTFSLEMQKKSIWLDLSNVSDPVEVVPVSYTVYLEECDISSPIKVSDLFTCWTSGIQVSDIALQIEIIVDRKKVSTKCFKPTDYMLNVDDNNYLLQNRRYLVKARSVNRIHPHLTPWKHILIITGKKTFGIDREAYTYINLARGIGRPLPKAENQIDKSIDTMDCTMPIAPIWPFSSMTGNKDFYDFSPEELRTVYQSDSCCYKRCFSLLANDFKENYLKHYIQYMGNIGRFFQLLLLNTIIIRPGLRKSNMDEFLLKNRLCLDIMFVLQDLVNLIGQQPQLGDQSDKSMQTSVFQMWHSNTNIESNQPDRKFGPTKRKRAREA